MINKHVFGETAMPMKQSTWILLMGLCLLWHGGAARAAQAPAPEKSTTTSPALTHLLTPPYCAPIEQVLGDIIGTRHIGYFADAIGTDGNVHMWFVSSGRRDWVQIVVYEDLQACIMAEGVSFGLALEPMAEPSPAAKALYPDLGLPVPEPAVKP